MRRLIVLALGAANLCGAASVLQVAPRLFFVENRGQFAAETRYVLYGSDKSFAFSRADRVSNCRRAP